MANIKMARTERGSRDGLKVETFVEGQEYDVPDALVLAFRTMGALDEGDGDAETTETPEYGATALETPEKPARRGRKPRA